MGSNANAASKTVAVRSNKNISENKQHLATPVPPSEHLVECENTVIEIKVKTMGQKRTSTTISSPTNRKDVEEKKRSSCSGDSHKSWGHVLAEQNKATIKRFQQVVPKALDTKSSKHSYETKKSTLSHQKKNHKYLDETPVKQSLLLKKAEEQIKSTPRTTNPSCTSVPSSSESIIVYDKSVQWDPCDFRDDDRFNVPNPVRTLSSLIKELERLVKDEKAIKILTNMKQVLYSIPIEHVKANSEVMDLRAKLDGQTLQLEKLSKIMNSSCSALRNEKDDLQRQVQNQALLLTAAQKKQLDLEATIKTLKQELEEALKIAENKEKTIANLMEELKGNEFSQKIIADLRTNLAEQTELTRQRHLEVQYLALEKDRLLALSSYKDALLNDLRNAIKDQLNDAKDIYVHAETSNPQMSLGHGGVVCSSPTSNSSHESNLPTSWHDISDISMSTVDHDRPKNENMQRDLREPNKPLALLETQIENSKKQSKNTEQSPTKDSTNLEFISLAGGESSLTLLPSYKDLGCTEISKCDNREIEHPAALSNQKNDNRRNFKSTNKVLSSENLNSSAEKILKKEIDAKEPVKIRKSMKLNKKSNFGRETEGIDNIPKANPIAPSLTEQFQNIFQDIRFQSGMIIKVPSPPRSYPHPEYSDSTLHSISTVSDLNVIQANDT